VGRGDAKKIVKTMRGSEPGTWTEDGLVLCGDDDYDDDDNNDNDDEDNNDGWWWSWWWFW